MAAALEVAGAGVLGMVCASAVAVAVAFAASSPAIQTSTPRSERQITNIDVLRQQIRNYYGDPLGSGTFAPDSNWAFNPTTNATFVTEQRFPAVPGMVALADQAASRDTRSSTSRAGPRPRRLRRWAT